MPCAPLTCALQVLTIHIILLVLTVLVLGYFVMLGVMPFVRAIGFETRRIAELIS